MVFLAVMYFTPLFGGGIADRFGRWRTIVLGAALLAFGYLVLALGLPVVPCVALLATGVGLFKGNLTALVGSLFPTDRARRAYSRFYWAVNLGSLPSGFVGGWLHSHSRFPRGVSGLLRRDGARGSIGFLTRPSFIQSTSTRQNRIMTASERDRIATILGSASPWPW